MGCSSGKSKSDSSKSLKDNKTSSGLGKSPQSMPVLARVQEPISQSVDQKLVLEFYKHIDQNSQYSMKIKVINLLIQNNCTDSDIEKVKQQIKTDYNKLKEDFCKRKVEEACKNHENSDKDAYEIKFFNIVLEKGEKQFKEYFILIDTLYKQFIQFLQGKQYQESLLDEISNLNSIELNNYNDTQKQKLHQDFNDKFLEKIEQFDKEQQKNMNNPYLIDKVFKSKISNSEDINLKSLIQLADSTLKTYQEYFQCVKQLNEQQNIIKQLSSSQIMQGIENRINKLKYVSNQQSYQFNIDPQGIEIQIEQNPNPNKSLHATNSKVNRGLQGKKVSDQESQEESECEYEEAQDNKPNQIDQQHKFIPSVVLHNQSTSTLVQQNGFGFLQSKNDQISKKNQSTSLLVGQNNFGFGLNQNEKDLGNNQLNQQSVIKNESSSKLVQQNNLDFNQKENKLPNNNQSIVNNQSTSVLVSQNGFGFNTNQNKNQSIVNSQSTSVLVQQNGFGFNKNQTIVNQQATNVLEEQNTFGFNKDQSNKNNQSVVNNQTSSVLVQQNNFGFNTNKNNQSKVNNQTTSTLVQENNFGFNMNQNGKANSNYQNQQSMDPKQTVSQYIQELEQDLQQNKQQKSSSLKTRDEDSIQKNYNAQKVISFLGSALITE